MIQTLQVIVLMAMTATASAGCIRHSEHVCKKCYCDQRVEHEHDCSCGCHEPPAAGRGSAMGGGGGVGSSGGVVAGDGLLGGLVGFTSLGLVLGDRLHGDRGPEYPSRSPSLPDSPGRQVVQPGEPISPGDTGRPVAPSNPDGPATPTNPNEVDQGGNSGRPNEVKQVSEPGTIFAFVAIVALGFLSYRQRRIK